MTQIPALTKTMVILATMGLGICGGCAHTFTFTSTPTLQAKENAWFMATWQPQTEGKASFIVFELTLQNKTQADLVIDWSQTFYVHDGRQRGLFLFEDYEPGYVKGTTQVTETVVPGQRLVKVMAPADLVAYSPVKYQNQVHPGDTPLSAGPIPPGENSILLSVSKEGDSLTETLSVTIHMDQSL